MEKTSVGILIFENVEVLDFAGPFEVFSRTRTVAGVESRRSDDDAPFQVFTVAKTTDPLFATGALKVVPEYSFRTAPRIDLLVVPGGFGTRALLDDEETLSWIGTVAADACQGFKRRHPSERIVGRQGIDQGGIGIVLPLDYYSEGMDNDEVRAIFEVAAERRAPIFVHVRRGKQKGLRIKVLNNQPRLFEESP